jgi:hypothetical protein
LLHQVVQGKMLENEVAAWIISFQTQEILLFRNAKTKEVVVGAEDKVEQCQYVAVLTRIDSELDDEVTGGWKVIEVHAFLQIPISANRSCLDGAQIFKGFLIIHFVNTIFTYFCVILQELTPQPQFIGKSNTNRES